jgi:hypothetical protein
VGTQRKKDADPDTLIRIIFSRRRLSQNSSAVDIDRQFLRPKTAADQQKAQLILLTQQLGAFHNLAS